MQEQLKRILDLDKVTFDIPGESQEQEAAFIQVETAQTRLVDKRQIARVTGTLRIFANSEKMPYGYLSKQLAKAASSDTRSWTFHKFDENRGTYRNIVERLATFTYLFDSQFDPSLGTITSVDFTQAET